MQRKLVKQGKGALTVSLPKKWLDLNNLEAGDFVEVDEEENKKLMISSQGQKFKKSIEINVEGFKNNKLRTTISGLYKAGYKEISLITKTGLNIKDLNQIVTSFTGLEIISKNKNSYKIGCFLENQENLIENLIIRLIQSTLYSMRTLGEEWNKINYEDFKTLSKVNNLKLRDHCLRLIHANRYSKDRSYDYYDFVTITEKISGHTYKFSNKIKELNIKRSDDFNELIKLLEKIYNGYLKKDYNTSDKLWIEIRDYMDSNFNKKEKNMDPISFAYWFHIMNLYRQLTSRLINLSL